MAKKIKLTEDELTNLIKGIVEQELEDEVLLDLDDENLDLDIESEEEEELEILSPEEIIGLMEEQILQLQDRVQYSEELLADMLEFTTTLMQDLENNSESSMAFRKSKQKLRALEGRAGREIFWLKSRRL
tara:strand:+ start:5750 stop:6139 length:390 start_codon:yes stop_codon:yes gene_type:complete